MASSWHDDEEDGLLPVIRKEVVPNHEIRTAEQRGSWNRFQKGLRSFYDRYVSGYAWDQVDRLREAKLREIESLSEERVAAAAASKAEARKLDAEAEFLYAQGEQTRLTSAERVMNLAEREAALREAIERIELKGGSVSFIVGDDEDEDDELEA